MYYNILLIVWNVFLIEVNNHNSVGHQILSFPEHCLVCGFVCGLSELRWWKPTWWSTMCLRDQILLISEAETKDWFTLTGTGIHVDK